MPDSRSKYLTAPLSSEKMPGGVPYIVGNEFAERFSFYGMKAILTVFMIQHLMNRSGQLDPMSEGEATFWFHMFTGGVYFTGIIGAILADGFFGKYRTIMALSLFYCAGHAALAIDDTRLGLAVGLVLILVGAGGIKPCVSAHVGDQFGSRNKHLITRVFGWFYIAINIGSFISTLLTPWLLNDQRFGPAWAFGVPGVLMFLATWVFWLGRNKFVHIPPGGKEFLRESFSGPGLRTLGKLSIIYVFVAAFWMLFDQTGSTWVIQARSMDRTVFGFTLYESQIQALNPFLILVLVPVFTYGVYPALGRVIHLTPIRKIAIGMFVAVIAFAVPALIEAEIDGGRIAKKAPQAPQKTARGDWSAWNLIDEESSDLRRRYTGWATKELTTGKAESKKSEDGQEPTGLGHVDIELRERRAWTISAVEINPYVIGAMNAKDAKVEQPEDFVDLDRLAKDVTVLVAEKASGTWTPVGRIELDRSDRFQRLEFPPVRARYVRLRIDSNWGGNHAALGRVRVLSEDAAAGPLIGDMRDVAAIGDKPHIIWQLLAYVLITAAEVMISITCLEFSYTQAPRKMKSFVMSLYLLSVAAGNFAVAGVNFFILNEDGTRKLEGAAYYWFFTSLMLVAAVLFVFVAMFYKERTYIQEEASPEQIAAAEAEGSDVR